MNLPNADHAVVEPAKITHYLLAFDHPEGGGKAEFFTQFGFVPEEWEVLRRALLTHAKTCPVSSIAQSPYGMKYRIDGPLLCPNGRSPLIRVVWIIDTGADAPRLVTAHPL